jgi:hypothetical protein
MKRFEYKETSLIDLYKSKDLYTKEDGKPLPDNFGNTELALNLLGSEGWEVILITGTWSLNNFKASPVVLLKREIV